MALTQQDRATKFVFIDPDQTNFNYFLNYCYFSKVFLFGVKSNGSIKMKAALRTYTAPRPVSGKLRLPILLRQVVPILAVIFFSVLFPAQAQDASERTVSFDAQNEPLSSIIERLSRTYGFGFTYNATDESFAAPVTFRAVNMPLKQALTELLQITGHNFHLIGNQVVIVPALRLQPTNEARVVAPDNDRKVRNAAVYEVPEQPKLADAIHLVDTVFVVQTVERTDTVIVRDTIWLEPEPSQRRPGRLPSIRQDIFRQEPDRDNGFWIGFGLSSFQYSMKYANEPETLELRQMVEQAEGIFFPNFSTTLKAGFTLQGWSIHTGIGISKFSQPFKHSFTISTGNYFRRDTLDAYFTVIQADTNWIFIMDSTWIPLDKQDFNTDILNRYTYIDLPVMVGFQRLIAPDLRVFINTGLNFAFPLSLTGKTISPYTLGTPENLSNFKITSPLTSFCFGAGVRYRMNALFDIVAGINTRMMLNRNLTDHPVRRRMNIASLNAGVIYNLP